MTIKQLAAAVVDKTGSDTDLIKAVIAVHQGKFPGSWQDWTVAGKTQLISRLIEQAMKDGETSPERIVPTFE